MLLILYLKQQFTYLKFFLSKFRIYLNIFTYWKSPKNSSLNSGVFSKEGLTSTKSIPTSCLDEANFLRI